MELFFLWNNSHKLLCSCNIMSKVAEFAWLADFFCKIDNSNICLAPGVDWSGMGLMCTDPCSHLRISLDIEVSEESYFTSGDKYLPTLSFSSSSSSLTQFSLTLTIRTCRFSKFNGKKSIKEKMRDFSEIFVVQDCKLIFSREFNTLITKICRSSFTMYLN